MAKVFEAKLLTENGGFVFTSLSDQSIAVLKAAVDSKKHANFWPKPGVRVYKLDRTKKGSRG